MIKGAVFDIDGTLLDSMSIWYDVGARYLKRCGAAPEPGLDRILFPMTIEESSFYMKEHYRLQPSCEAIRDSVLQIVRDFYLEEVLLKPGVLEFLEQLRIQGIPMVLATTNDRELTTAALKRCGVDHYFDRLFSAAELTTTKKEPLIYQKAAEFLGCVPEEAFVFEDLLHALRTAKNGGFRTVAVEDAASASDQAALMEEADYYLADYSDFDRFWTFACG